MKNIPTIFLQFIVILIGVAALAFLLGEPHLEGKNVDATFFEVYFNDPFLAFVYLGSIPFFVGLWQAFKVLGFVRRDRIFSPEAIRAVSTIRLCALATAGVIVAVIIFLGIHARLSPEPGAVDGPEGAIVLGLTLTLFSITVAAVATVLKDVLKKGVSC